MASNAGDPPDFDDRRQRRDFKPGFDGPGARPGGPGGDRRGSDCPGGDWSGGGWPGGGWSGGGWPGGGWPGGDWSGVEGAGPDAPGPGDIEDLIRLYLNALRLMIEALPPAASQAFDGPRMGSDREILMLLARAQSVWLTSGLRYWKQMAEIFASQGIGLADLVRPTPEAADDAAPGGQTDARTLRRLILLDKARACLREVADASMSEAEALRAQLMQIEAELRASQSGDLDPAPQGKRNVRAKP